MNILVLNCGSSSIKYQFIEMSAAKVMARGTVEKVGIQGSFIKHELYGQEAVVIEGDIADHQAGIEKFLSLLTSQQYGCVKSFNDIHAVGHRVVHGGEKFNSSVLITKEVVDIMEQCSVLAPLHNPPILKGIAAMQNILPNVPQVGVFDTAFHQTMPQYAYQYAIPYEMYQKHAIRRYGFHGTSHRYVSQRACEILGRDIKTQKIITCHIGNGGSVSAVKYGKSIDTSMGLTPVEGLVMGTRCGDLDAGVLTCLMKEENMDLNAINNFINKKSGLLGVSGVSSDMRELQNAAKQGNERAQLAIDMFCYRVRKYIGAYTAVMGGVDIIVFTGGIGENADAVRASISKDFEYLGLKFDASKNDGIRGKEQIISTDDSKVTLMVIPTNEEWVIAQDTLAIVKTIQK